MDDGFKSEVTEGISDHKAVLVQVSLLIKKPHTLYTSFPNFDCADDASVIDTLSVNFDHTVQFSACNDVNVLVSFFENLILSCIHRFVPVKTKKKKNLSKP